MTCPGGWWAFESWCFLNGALWPHYAPHMFCSKKNTGTQINKFLIHHFEKLWKQRIFQTVSYVFSKWSVIDFSLALSTALQMCCCITELSVFLSIMFSCCPSVCYSYEHPPVRLSGHSCESDILRMFRGIFLKTCTNVWHEHELISLTAASCAHFLWMQHFKKAIGDYLLTLLKRLKGNDFFQVWYKLAFGLDRQKMVKDDQNGILAFKICPN